MRIKLSDKNSESQPVSEKEEKKNKEDYLCKPTPINTSPTQCEED